MVFLIACGHCGRQFDATGRGFGERFRCFCGEVVDIVPPEARDMAVLRCPSCGAGAIEGRPSCVFCGTTFSIFDADRTIICGACFTRCSQAARYCHHCATPLTADAQAGTATDFRCPSCAIGASPGDPERWLSSRRVEEMTFLECPGCAGLWLEHGAIRHVTTKARREAAPYDPVAHGHAIAKMREQLHSQPIVYRPCPTCHVQMARLNWGRVTGVVVDQCPTHGIWFDHGELEHILAWIRAGGEERARRSAEKEKEINKKLVGPHDDELGLTAHGPREMESFELPGTFTEAALQLATESLKYIFRRT